MYRCWFPVDSPEGRDALARNKRDGFVPGETPVAVNTAPTAF